MLSYLYENNYIIIYLSSNYNSVKSGKYKHLETRAKAFTLGGIHNVEVFS